MQACHNKQDYQVHLLLGRHFGARYQGTVGAIRPEYAPVVKLLSDGISRREIAKELGVPKSTVIDWVRKIQELTLKFMEDII